MTGNMTREHIVKTLNETRRPAELTYVALFGSFARGEASAESDIDVLYDYEKVPAFSELLDWKTRLEDQLGRKVEIVSRRAIRHPKLKMYINNDLVPVMV